MGLYLVTMGLCMRQAHPMGLYLVIPSLYLVTMGLCMRQAHPKTAIAHYLGAYVLQTGIGTRIHFVVTSNVFSFSKRIHEQYELKVPPDSLRTEKLLNNY